MSSVTARPYIMAGNHKLNKTIPECDVYGDELIAELEAAGFEGQTADKQIIVCPSDVNVYFMSQKFKNTGIMVGGQNMSAETKGAHTGSTSAAQLMAAGAKYVIIGHSERRIEPIKERTRDINQKIKKALESGITPILCVGETIQDRMMKGERSRIRLQTGGALLDIPPEQVKNVIIAYEPVWAIGTGRTATPEQANEICSSIRSYIGDLKDGLFAERYEEIGDIEGRKAFEELVKGVANQMPILYGGSLNPTNATDLLRQPDIDGGLIGGASLNVHDFALTIANGAIGREQKLALQDSRSVTCNLKATQNLNEVTL